jgi:hypothetical protein
MEILMDDYSKPIAEGIEQLSGYMDTLNEKTFFFKSFSGTSLKNCFVIKMSGIAETHYNTIW